MFAASDEVLFKIKKKFQSTHLARPPGQASLKKKKLVFCFFFFLPCSPQLCKRHEPFDCPPHCPRRKKGTAHHPIFFFAVTGGMGAEGGRGGVKNFFSRRFTIQQQMGLLAKLHLLLP